MTTASLQPALTSLADARKVTQALIDRLAKLPSSPGVDDADVRRELSVEIHQLLKEQDVELDWVRQEVDDVIVGRDRVHEAERARLLITVQRLAEDLKRYLFSSLPWYNPLGMLTTVVLPDQSPHPLSTSTVTGETQSRTRSAASAACVTLGRLQRGRTRPESWSSTSHHPPGRPLARRRGGQRVQRRDGRPATDPPIDAIRALTLPVYTRYPP